MLLVGALAVSLGAAKPGLESFLLPNLWLFSRFVAFLNLANFQFSVENYILHSELLILKLSSIFYFLTSFSFGAGKAPEISPQAMRLSNLYPMQLGILLIHKIPHARLRANGSYPRLLLRWQL